MNLPLNAQPGDWFVVRSNALDSWAIRALTHSTVNHAAIYIGDGQLIEAWPRGVRQHAVAEYDGCLQAWSTGIIDYTAEERQKIVAYALSERGVEYGFVDLLAIGLPLLGIRPKWVLTRLYDADSVICSQLVAQASAGAGVQLTTTSPPLVTPGILWDLLQKK